MGVSWLHLQVFVVLFASSVEGLQCGQRHLIRSVPSVSAAKPSLSPRLRKLQGSHVLFSAETSSADDMHNLNDVSLPPAHDVPLVLPDKVAAQLGPLKWRKVVSLLSVQLSLFVGLPCLVSQAAFGSPLRVFGSGSLLLKGGLEATLGFGVLATAPLLALVAAEEILQLETRFPVGERTETERTS